MIDNDVDLNGLNFQELRNHLVKAQEDLNHQSAMTKLARNERDHVTERYTNLKDKVKEAQVRMDLLNTSLKSCLQEGAQPARPAHEKPLGLIYPAWRGYSNQDEIQDLKNAINTLWGFLDKNQQKAFVQTDAFELIMEKSTGMAVEFLTVADSEHFPGWSE